MNNSSSCSSVKMEASDEDNFLLASNKPKKRAGRKKFKETRHPVYRVRRRNNDKWVCELREPCSQKRIWLGSYPTAEMAARAHDVAALALGGPSATLNFADSAWRLQVPVSTDPKELRQAAARAAEAFGPRVLEENINVNTGDQEMKDVEPQEINVEYNCMQNMVVATEENSNALYNNSSGIEEWQGNMEEGCLFSPNPCLYGSHFSWMIMWKVV